MHPNTYAVVQSTSKDRNGWMVGYKTGDSIRHDRLEAPTADREAARAEAQRLLPDRLIWVAGDDGPAPWNQPPTLEVTR